MSERPNTSLDTSRQSHVSKLLALTVNKRCRNKRQEHRKEHSAHY